MNKKIEKIKKLSLKISVFSEEYERNRPRTKYPITG